MKELEYPFNSEYLLRKYRTIKKQLLTKENLVEKRIAILGGSTTNDVRDMLEIFLLDQGICPIFYESEYGKYWEDAVFGNETLLAFHPDIVYVHTSARNISIFPEIAHSSDLVNAMLDQEYEHFKVMWDKLYETYGCLIIQNNFEYPYYRLLGNRDASDYRGSVNYITRLNLKFYEYAQINDYFYINDINYQAATYGLEKWADPFYWYAYKYALCMNAIPTLAFNIANIIKSIYGKNKKALAIDLDNTLWKGIVGDDGVENLVLGHETPTGQAYIEFQQYLKKIKQLGIVLTIISKNDYENAILGIRHPEMILKEEDFLVIKANWEQKSQNLIQIADELSLGVDSFVFVDDNPAERENIRLQISGVGIAELESVEKYISSIDKAGFFETTISSKDDINRNEMYKENLVREQQKKLFVDYEDYLRSLDMKAEILPFEEMHLSRIAQLTNKSNQFNLTTRRYTKEELQSISLSDNYITLYGKLTDRFGDNGIVSVVIGKINENNELDILLWLMSCRVLKRDLELALMDELVKIAKKKKINKIYGYYYPTAKNSMVSSFYCSQGFTKMSEDNKGNTVWLLELGNDYVKKNHIIEVNGGK